jgi:hypothetical protein
MAGLSDVRWGEHSKRRLIIHDRERLLFHVVLARHSPGSLSGSLYCREEQSYQDSNNGYDDQQFYESESKPLSRIPIPRSRSLRGYTKEIAPSFDFIAIKFET